MALPTALTNKELLAIKAWYDNACNDGLGNVPVVIKIGELLGELSRYRACLTDLVPHKEN